MIYFSVLGTRDRISECGLVETDHSCFLRDKVFCWLADEPGGRDILGTVGLEKRKAVHVDNRVWVLWYTASSHVTVGSAVDPPTGMSLAGQKMCGVEKRQC